MGRWGLWGRLDGWLGLTLTLALHSGQSECTRYGDDKNEEEDGEDAVADDLFLQRAKKTKGGGYDVL